jgi:hypothetical protein
LQNKICWGSKLLPFLNRSLNGFAITENPFTKLSKLSATGGNLFIAGDFNLPTIDWSSTDHLTIRNYAENSAAYHFVETLVNSSLCQIVSEPTRFRQNQNPSTLNLILVNDPACGLQSIIDKCRICGTEGESIEHIISSCTVLAQSEYKKRHDIFAKIIHMNLAVKFNLLKDTQPHYIYKPESCLENDNYKLYFDRTVLTDIHIHHNRPDIIILNKQQKQAYLLDIAVPNSHNITQTYNTKINKYLELSVAMRNLWCLEKISILPFIISTTGIVPQSLFKNLKILDLEKTLVVEIQKGILLYSCHIVRKFLNIDTEHKTQKSQNVEARRR